MKPTLKVGFYDTYCVLTLGNEQSILNSKIIGEEIEKLVAKSKRGTK